MLNDKAIHSDSHEVISGVSTQNQARPRPKNVDWHPRLALFFIC